nr:PREDICTED: protein ELFN1 [Bos mutus]
MGKQAEAPGDKGFVWLAICSQNQPPYEAIPQQINSTIVDLRLNENRIRSVQYAALSRFGNLTYLNLTKNEIGYIEDGAFSGQFNLQVLQLGYNRLRNLTEGVLRGLGKLEYLYLQANLIEAVAPGAFWECPNIVNVDLSMNRIQRLHSATFAGLARLSVCELYSNPFYCSCELLGFLRWLAAFANATQAHDRVQCESPPLYSGYFLLGQGRHGQRSILGKLQSVCTDGPYAAETRPAPGRVKQLTQNSATITVQLPSPFTRMYTLEHFNNSKSSTVSRLTRAQEEIRLTNLYALTNYTYCVVSSSSGLHHNHTCLTIWPGSLKKTIIELKYGPELEAPGLAPLSQGPLLGPEAVTRIPYLPAAPGEVEQYQLAEGSGTPKGSKGGYMEVRAAEQAERREGEQGRPGPDSQSSVAEISTIAKEVDKVNQIINNCIDALKLDSASFLGSGSGGGDPEMAFECQSLPAASTTSSTATPVPGVLERPSFLSPPYKEGSHHPLQRQLRWSGPGPLPGPALPPRPGRTHSLFLTQTPEHRGGGSLGDARWAPGSLALGSSSPCHGVQEDSSRNPETEGWCPSRAVQAGLPERTVATARGGPGDSHSHLAQSSAVAPGEKLAERLCKGAVKALEGGVQWGTASPRTPQIAPPDVPAPIS